jgi:hypothetical protein
LRVQSRDFQCIQMDCFTTFAKTITRHCEERRQSPVIARSEDNHPSLRGAKRRGNPRVYAAQARLLRCARKDRVSVHKDKPPSVIARSKDKPHPSLRGAKRRGNPRVYAAQARLLRCARKDRVSVHKDKPPVIARSKDNPRHCEEQSDVAIQGFTRAQDGLLRCARKDRVSVHKDKPPVIAPITFNIPLQLLSYHVELIKGTDVDQPRNLAKSVTVE